MLDDLGTDKKELLIPSFEKSSFRYEFNKEGQLLHKYPKKPIKPNDNRQQFNILDIIIVFIVSSIVAFIAFYIIGFLNESIVCNIIHEITGSGQIYEYISEVILTIIAVIAPFVITYLVNFKDVIKINSDYKKTFNEYEIAIQKYKNDCKRIDENNAVTKHKNTELWNYKKGEYDKWVEKEKEDYLIYSQQYDAEVNVKRRIYEQEINDAQLKLSAVESILKTLYSMRINDIVCIHPHYQGLVPITVIYGYFDTGRCSSLRGYEGAYNLYEDEKIKGIIKNKLDEIKEELRSLNSTMTYVGIALANCGEQLDILNRNMENLIVETSRMKSSFTETMHEMNNNMINYHQNMDDYVKQIEGNTANSAYYSEVGAKISALNTFYSIYKDF